MTTLPGVVLEQSGAGAGCQSETVEVSVVMPCLNEARTVAACVRVALEAIENANLVGEVIVADNGSDDGSQEIARDAGARVVSARERGYGSALQAGIAEARGEYVLMGDADGSYDFGDLPLFVDRLRCGHDLVMGNRFAGGIQEGAMPFLNRYLGNPVLSWIGRLLYRTPVRDFHCGLRAFRRDSWQRMQLRSSGMEFASEMVVRASVLRMSIAEVPTTLSPDGRNRPPHLRRWRDGWRHLRYMFKYRLLQE